MAQQTQLNTRLDVNVKREGDAVFARYGLTPSSVIRSVWEYAVKNQKPPEFMVAEQQAEALEARMNTIRESAGLALKLAGQQGTKLANAPVNLDSLREDMYEGMLDEYEELFEAKALDD